MKRVAAFAAGLGLLCSAALADAPTQSIHPVLRPVVVVAQNAGPAGMGAISLGGAVSGDVGVPLPRVAGSLPPRPRPDMAAPSLPKAADVTSASTSAAAVAPMPEARPRKGLFGFLKTAKSPQPQDSQTFSPAGSVCGVPGIKGRKIAPITSSVAGCGVPEAVEITSVDGVALSEAATIDCGTAIALNTWVQSGAKPAVGRMGGGIAGLRVAAHYTCRPRNNVHGAKISEHGKGKAIDISAILLKDGSAMEVAGDYRRGKYSKALKAMHRAACSPFGTTLGPGSDGMHEDHLHFDTASYRSGPYCK